MNNISAASARALGQLETHLSAHTAGIAARKAIEGWNDQFQRTHEALTRDVVEGRTDNVIKHGHYKLQLLGKFDQAQRLLQSAAAGSTNVVGVNREQAELALQRGDTEQALKFADDEIFADLLTIVRAHVLRGDGNEALNALAKARYAMHDEFDGRDEFHFAAVQFSMIEAQVAHLHDDRATCERALADAERDAPKFGAFAAMALVWGSIGNTNKARDWMLRGLENPREASECNDQHLLLVPHSPFLRNIPDTDPFWGPVRANAAGHISQLAVEVEPPSAGEIASLFSGRRRSSNPFHFVFRFGHGEGHDLETGRVDKGT